MAEALAANGVEEADAEFALAQLEPMTEARRAGLQREEGNKAFRAHDYAQAMLHYTQALAALDAGQDAVPEAAAAECRIAVLSNRAACQLKLGRHEEPSARVLSFDGTPPHVPLLGVPIGIHRRCHQNDSLADG